MFSSAKKSFIRTFTGRKLFPYKPEAEQIHITDITHALSNICRYTGHTKRFYSVAEHSLLCYHIAQSEGYDKKVQLYCLMHDFSEAYVNDMASPLKKFLKKYIKTENKIMDKIFEKFSVPVWESHEKEIVKLVDETMLYSEMKHLMGDYDTENTFIDKERLDYDFNLLDESYEYFEYTHEQLQDALAFKFMQAYQEAFNEGLL